ncbi:MAG: biotin transporter BioY [Dehalococcoidia bacterium]|nr:biotin transporter BioY [Dehalococcoidia bacterium]
MSMTTPALRRTLVAIPSTWPRALASAALVAIGVAILGLSAQFSVRLPVTPVPITGQTLGVLLVGAAYGPRLGLATGVAYVLAGAAGLPVFAGGFSGLAIFAKPSAGYLVGFLPAMALVGALAERGWDRRPTLTVAAMVLGNIVIYAAGVAWLQGFVGWERVWALGVLPFLLGDAIKIGVAAAALPLAWRLRGLGR